MEYPCFGIVFSELKFSENQNQQIFALSENEICYNPQELIKTFKEDAEALKAGMLHTLIHFILGHDLTEGGDEKKDREVHDILTEMGEESLPDSHELWKREEGEDNNQRKEDRLKLSKKVMAGAQVLSKGSSAKGFMQSLRRAIRVKKDYRRILKNFIIPREEMKVSPDEYDMILYSYGLSLYKDMPLVEMNEYTEQGKIRDLVIAIDTSGSTSGALVQEFLDKTYSILCEDMYFDLFRIHILQCDSSVQKDTLIQSRQEMEKLIKNLTISGFGATDFRPVFEYTDKLIKENKISRLQGLIYFTDGRGIYPAFPPAYKTLFIYPEDKYLPEIKCPAWAIKEQL